MLTTSQILEKSVFLYFRIREGSPRARSSSLSTPERKRPIETLDEEKKQPEELPTN